MYEAAIDPAPDRVSIALKKDGSILIHKHCAMRGRDSSSLADFVEKTFAEFGVKIGEVSKWSVGSGPGSFTGLRQAAALVAGWCFGRDSVEKRCVPGAVAMAAAAFTAPEEGLKVTTLYDGRNSEILYYELEYRDGSWASTGNTGVLNMDQAKDCPFLKQALSCYDWELERIRKIVPDLGIATAVEGDAAALIDVKTPEYDGDLTRLVYIRPAVY